VEKTIENEKINEEEGKITSMQVGVPFSLKALKQKDIEVITTVEYSYSDRFIGGRKFDGTFADWLMICVNSEARDKWIEEHKEEPEVI